MAAAALLGRFEIDAAQLWREHPPVLHNAAKLTLLELAGGATRAPRGTLSVTRWTPGEIPAVGATLSMRVHSVEGPFAYPAPEAGVDAWHMNFADPQLFAFYGTPAFAQDEIQVAEHPLLASVRQRMLADPSMPALTFQNGTPTPVLVRGVERWCAIDTDPELASPYGIYGRKLQRASLEALTQAVKRVDDSYSNILAVCAPQGGGRYSASEIREVLVTAVTGFAAAKDESRGRGRLRIYTGHWGTGAFGGNRVLMAAAQLLAARCVGVDELLYHSLDDDGVRTFEEGKRIAMSVAEGTSLDAIVELLDARGFRWGSSDGN